MSVIASDPIIVGNIALSFHRAAADVTRRVVYLSGYRDRVRVLRPHSQPYRLWAVPPYVPVDEVGEVSDLARPGIAERMTKAVDGINPGAGISRFSVTMVGAYGLDRAGYTSAHGDEEGFTARVDRGVAAREWFVIPLWRPQYLNRAPSSAPTRRAQGAAGHRGRRLPGHQPGGTGSHPLRGGLPIGRSPSGQRRCRGDRHAHQRRRAEPAAGRRPLPRRPPLRTPSLTRATPLQREPVAHRHRPHRKGITL